MIYVVLLLAIAIITLWLQLKLTLISYLQLCFCQIIAVVVNRPRPLVTGAFAKLHMLL